jgi:hypothetical protein
MSNAMDVNSLENRNIIKVTIDNSKQNDDEQSLLERTCSCHDICPICLDNIGMTNTVTLLCNHKFHFACYNQYLCKTLLEKRSSVKCPYCKDSIYQINAVDDFPSNRQYMVVGNVSHSVNGSVDSEEIERRIICFCIDSTMLINLIQFIAHVGVIVVFLYVATKIVYSIVSIGM